MSAVPCRRHDRPTRRVDSPTLSGLLDISRARSLERRSPNLLATIIEQAITRARARKGAIILPYGGARSVIVQGVAGRSLTAGSRSIYLEDDNDLPRSIIRHVLRTSAAVSLESAIEYGRFARDPYLRRIRPRSIHCLPLLAENRLIGVLYLENRPTRSASSAHTDDLGLLAADIARAIDAAYRGDASERAAVKRAKTITGALGDEEPTQGTVSWNRTHAGEGYTYALPHETCAPDPTVIRTQEEHASMRARLLRAESAEAYLRVMLEEAPDATIMTTRDGRIALVNRQTETLFGYGRDALIGQSIEVLIPERLRGAHTRHRARYARSPKARSMGQGLRLFGRHRDGSEFPVEVSLSFFETPLGFHVVSSIRDATALRATEHALRASERFSRATLDALTEHICVLDEHGEIVATNMAWRVFASANGANAARIDVGTNYLAVCDAATGDEADVAHHFAAGIRHVMRGGQDRCAVEYSCHAPHEQRWFIARATRFSGDGPIRIVVAHENITEVKLAEEALRAAKEAAEAARRRAEIAERQKEERRQEAERRRQVAENLRDVLATLNSSWPLEDVLRFIVRQSRRLLGGQAAALYRRRGENGRLEIQVGDDVSLDDAMTTMTAVNAETMSNQPSRQRSGAATGEAGRPHRVNESSEAPGYIVGARDIPEPLVETVALEGKRESVAPAVPVPQPFQSVLAIPVVGADEDYGSLAIYRQNRESFTAEEANLAALFGDQAALAVENARLRDKAREAAVREERDRIARDLHDSVTQAIFSASIIADSLPRVWERSPATGKQGLDELRDLTHGALAEMRTLLLELRPTAIMEKKLSDLIAQLGGALRSRTRVAFDITLHEQGSLPPAVHTALYRIVQEATNNIAKHADARHIWVQGRISPGRAQLRVFDDGRGFDIGAVPKGQLGISIMQERARSIEARLRIHSRPGRGTLVAVMWDDTEGRQPNA